MSTLKNAGKIARVNTQSFHVDDKSDMAKKFGTGTFHLAWERDESIFVVSRDKKDLANLLIDWSLIKQYSPTTLVQLGGRRGFRIACIPAEEGVGHQGAYNHFKAEVED